MLSVDCLCRVRVRCFIHCAWLRALRSTPQHHAQVIPSKGNAHAAMNNLRIDTLCNRTSSEKSTRQHDPPSTPSVIAMRGTCPPDTCAAQKHLCGCYCWALLVLAVRPRMLPRHCKHALPSLMAAIVTHVLIRGRSQIVLLCNWAQHVGTPHTLSKLCAIPLMPRPACYNRHGASCIPKACTNKHTGARTSLHGSMQ